MTDPAVPLDFKKGLGYSPNSGPPVGGWEYMPVSSFYGDPLRELLPSGRSYFGRRSRRFSNSTYPLANQPNPNIDMKTFPLTPTGPGLTSGGTGGVWLQGMPNFNSYWGYGSKKRRKSRRKRSKKRRKSRKAKRSKRKSRRSSKKKCPVCHCNCKNCKCKASKKRRRRRSRV